MKHTKKAVGETTMIENDKDSFKEGFGVRWKPGENEELRLLLLCATGKLYDAILNIERMKGLLNKDLRFPPPDKEINKMLQKIKEVNGDLLNFLIQNFSFWIPVVEKKNIGEED